jgi:hypothetical protein
MSVAGYVGYIALMGLVLAVGSARTLMDRRFGLPLIGTFLVLYAALFLNFLTINRKVVHLAVCAVLFLALLGIKWRPVTSQRDADHGP